jgi:NAD(P)-dependent dehydrogenase (short-subunit alcohol dehydrogenase family)
LSVRVDADLTRRVCLVTGANSGIGRETALALARLGADVVMACRDRARGEAARDLIAKEAGRAPELLIVDLSSQRSIRDFAGEFQRRRSALHVLVNNAGIWSERRRESADGIELVWATNQLGYFLLSELLLDLLKRSAPARIVNVASRLARNLDLDDVEWKRRRYDGVQAYAQTKQANRMWTWALARRLEGSGVTANALHPGGVNTALFSKGGGWRSLLAWAFMTVKGKTAAEGADTVVWLAASPEVAGLSGKYWVDRREATCRYRDRGREEELWALCERMTRQET